MQKLVITALADPDLGMQSVTWEIALPFDLNDRPVIIAEWQRREFLKRMCEVFSDVTGRKCSGRYAIENESASAETQSDLKLIAKHKTEGVTIYEDSEGNMFYDDGRGLHPLTPDEYDAITFSDPDAWELYDDDDDENGAFSSVFFEPR